MIVKGCHLEVEMKDSKVLIKAISFPLVSFLPLLHSLASLLSLLMLFFLPPSFISPPICFHPIARRGRGVKTNPIINERRAVGDGRETLGRLRKSERLRRTIGRVREQRNWSSQSDLSRAFISTTETVLLFYVICKGVIQLPTMFKLCIHFTGSVVGLLIVVIKWLAVFVGQ